MRDDWREARERWGGVRLDWVDRLTSQFLTNARHERDRSREDLAATWEEAAGDLLKAEQDWQLTRLTIPDASRESGYSRQGLHKAIARGELRNVGSRMTPLVLRADLPRKARKAVELNPQLADELRRDDG